MTDYTGSRVISSKPFVCPHCGLPANGLARGIAYWDGYNHEGNQVDPPMQWTFVQCDRCEQPALEIRENFGNGFDSDEVNFVYPAPSRLSASIPAPLRREWEEAKKCFDATAYTAALVKVRRTLEGTCRDQGIKNKNLAAALKKLSEDGRIDGTLGEWADALRIAGNQGAHFTDKPVSRQDAEDALSFAEALLDHLYVLRLRFEQFRARISN